MAASSGMIASTGARTGRCTEVCRRWIAVRTPEEIEASAFARDAVSASEDKMKVRDEWAYLGGLPAQAPHVTMVLPLIQQTWLGSNAGGGLEEAARDLVSAIVS
ncbi:MAG: hypothetical protein M1830_000109 [Pleopsidium flavum]|nr:MAG: hypothetical protein M1830_000109 [Pleopsidium flavum]